MGATEAPPEGGGAGSFALGKEEGCLVDIGAYLPFWEELTQEQQESLSRAVIERVFPKGALVSGGETDCAGLVLPVTGQLRAYLLTEEGKELTLYRLLPGELCLFSASCAMRGIQFDVMVEAQQETKALIFPAPLYQDLMEASAPVANFTNQLMAGRFSDVMWLMDQILSKKLDSRLAAFLVEEGRIVGGGELSLTHDQIARHLGSAREVVTRMLKYFQAEGLVRLSRGGVQLLDLAALERLAAVSLREK